MAKLRKKIAPASTAEDVAAIEAQTAAILQETKAINADIDAKLKAALRNEQAEAAQETLTSGDLTAVADVECVKLSLPASLTTADKIADYKGEYERLDEEIHAFGRVIIHTLDQMIPLLAEMKQLLSRKSCTRSLKDGLPPWGDYLDGIAEEFSISKRTIQRRLHDLNHPDDDVEDDGDDEDDGGVGEGDGGGELFERNQFKSEILADAAVRMSRDAIRCSMMPDLSESSRLKRLMAHAEHVMEMVMEENYKPLPSATAIRIGDTLSFELRTGVVNSASVETPTAFRVVSIPDDYSVGDNLVTPYPWSTRNSVYRIKGDKPGRRYANIILEIDPPAGKKQEDVGGVKAKKQSPVPCVSVDTAKPTGRTDGTTIGGEIQIPEAPPLVNPSDFVTIATETPLALKGCRYIYTPSGAAFEYAPLATNPYNGCGHNCLYCYVPLARHMNEEKKAAFHAVSEFRTFFISRLTGDAIKYQAAGITEQVLFCFSTDAYNPTFNPGLTRRCLEIVQQYGMGICMLTKGGKRSLTDIDLYRADRDCYAATLTSLDDDFSKKWESRAALPAERIAVLKQFHDKGIFTWVSLEPTLSVEASLEIVKATHGFVDLYKIGKANYLGEYAKKIDWRDYTLRMVDLCSKLDVKHYIKRNLQKYLPAGYSNPMRVKQHF